MIHVTFVKDIGKIMGHISDHESTMSLQLAHLPEWADSVEWEEAVDGDLYYYDLANTMRPRPSITATISKTIFAADGIDSITLSDLPLDCEVSMGGVSYPTEEGTFEFGILTTGTYILSVDFFPYVSATWEVTAI